MAKTRPTPEDLIETIERRAHDAGYHTVFNASQTTGSLYLTIGEPTATGGIRRRVEVRISGHPKPGSRAGWKQAGTQFDLRSTAPVWKIKADIEAIFDRIGRGGGRGERIELRPIG